MFYKKSRCTTATLKLRSSRAIEYCQDDIIVEYNWSEGKPTGQFYYENGKLKGSEKIQLIKQDDSLQNGD